MAERASRLKEIGFCFAVNWPRIWDNMLNQLLEYKAANGHTIVLVRSGQLGQWAKSQHHQ